MQRIYFFLQKIELVKKMIISNRSARMIWIDIQRMQILQWEPELNQGTPYMRLRAFLDNGKRIHNEIIQCESFHMIPDIHYFSEDNEFIATLRVLPEGSSSSGWKSIIFKED